MNTSRFTRIFRAFHNFTSVLLFMFLGVLSASAQTSAATQLADLLALRSKVSNPDTRIRVDAFHRVWSIGLSSGDSDVKLAALQLLAEPVGSSSDHIRMPAVYAIADIADSTSDPKVKVRALETLSQPLSAGQAPIRNAAIDAVNNITASANRSEVAVAAVRALAPPLKSGVNGVRIPAINALLRAVNGSQNDAAYNAALDLLSDPLESSAMIGGMEVRLMAVVAVERIGVEAAETSTKAKAMGLMRAYAAKGGWEPEAKRRADEAATSIQNSIKKS